MVGYVFSPDYYGDSCPDEEQTENIPDVDLVYWDYYHLDEKDYDRCIKKHLKITDNLILRVERGNGAVLPLQTSIALRQPKPRLKPRLQTELRGSLLQVGEITAENVRCLQCFPR